MLTEEEISEFRACFCMFDDKQLGYIVTKNMRDLLKTLGFNPTDKHLQHAIFTVDWDKNGRIDYEEFLALMEMLKQEEQDEVKEGPYQLHLISYACFLGATL